MPRLHSNVTIVIDVIDVNDEMPRFNQSSYYAQVSEAAATGTTVIQLYAMDKDQVKNTNQLTAIVR